MLDKVAKKPTVINVLLLCCLLSLFTNVIFSTLNLPVLVAKLFLASRDMLIFCCAIFWPFIISRKLTVFQFYVYLLILVSIFSFIIQLFIVKSPVPIEMSISHSRVVLALPILVIIYVVVWKKEYNKSSNSIIERLFRFFLCICLIESCMLITGYYSNYLSFINFEEYMSGKGTSSGTAFGFFGSRIITPMFNASVGGTVLGVYLGYNLLMGRKSLALITLIPLIFTVSKTGYLIAVIFILFRKYSYMFFLTASFAYISLAFFFISFDIRQLPVPEYFVMHLASIEYHMHGLITGFNVIFEPVGLGFSGTTPGIKLDRLIGRESGFGTGLGAIGFFYLIMFIISAYILCKKYNLVGYTLVSIYFMVALMNEGASVLYIWVPIFLLFISKPNSSQIQITSNNIERNNR